MTLEAELAEIGEKMDELYDLVPKRLEKDRLAINEANRQRVAAYRRHDLLIDRIETARVELIDFADSLPQSDPCHLDLRKIVATLCGE